MWPFRKQAPPDPKVARNLGEGRWEVSIWMAVAFKQTGPTTYVPRFQMFDSPEEAELRAEEWLATGDYDTAYMKEAGTMTITLPAPFLTAETVARVRDLLPFWEEEKRKKEGTA